MAATQEAVTHACITLEMNCDSVDWCTSPGHEDLLAVGIYELDESSGHRAGRLRLFECGAASLAASGDAPGGMALAALGEVDVPGVLDVRWFPGADEPPMLLASLADGSVRAFSTAAGAAAPVEAARLCGGPGSGLALSVDCCVRQGAEARLACSYSSGRVAVMEATPSTLRELCGWQGHELEAWVAASDPWDPSCLYSGGDDAVFCMWDVRAPLAGDGPPRAAHRDTKTHGAGVCSVTPSPHDEHAVLTGSYDERARLWDKRQLARPLAELRAGGGVWRLRWHPTDPSLVLAALMHAGFGILAVQLDAGTLALAESYKHQRSLAYGAGWKARVGADGISTVATCSFYDRMLHVWSPHTKTAAPAVPTQ